MKPLMPDVDVNGETIPSAAIAAEAQNHNAPEGKPGIAWRAAAQALVVRSLLLQAATKRGLTAIPADLPGDRRESDEDALIQKLLDQELSVEPVSEPETRALWEKRKDHFRAPDLFEASHILVAADPANAKARAEAEQKVVSLAETLAAQPRKFGDIAKDFSDCSSASSAGQLGQIGPGEMVPEFEAALLSLAKGEITATPVETQFGFHLVRLDNKVEGAVLPYETAKAGIQRNLEKMAWARAAKRFVANLVAEATITGVDMNAPVTE